MVNINTLGVLFPNTYDDMLPEMVRLRAMGSVPFAGRYRMIDFPLSAMVNAGIQNVTVLVKQNYYSLMDHLGSGREWDLARKRGGLRIVPPYALAQNKVYHGRVEALCSILGFWRASARSTSSSATATSPPGSTSRPSSRRTRPRAPM